MPLKIHNSNISDGYSDEGDKPGSPFENIRLILNYLPNPCCYPAISFGIYYFFLYKILSARIYALSNKEKHGRLKGQATPCCKEQSLTPPHTGIINWERREKSVRRIFHIGKENVDLQALMKKIAANCNLSLK